MLKFVLQDIIIIIIVFYFRLTMLLWYLRKYLTNLDEIGFIYRKILTDWLNINPSKNIADHGVFECDKDAQICKYQSYTPKNVS